MWDREQDDYSSASIVKEEGFFEKRGGGVTLWFPPVLGLTLPSNRSELVGEWLPGDGS